MDTYARLNALADSEHTCTTNWSDECWACKASALLNDLHNEGRYLLHRFDAAQVEVTKARTP